VTTGIWSGACAAMIFALAAGPTAQSPVTSPGRSEQHLTVTGCVERSAERQTKLVLTNASVITTGTTRTDATTAAAPRLAVAVEGFRLDVEGRAKLTSHVGQMVQITGTLQQPPGMISAQANAGMSPVRPPAMLKVDTVQMIAAACPQWAANGYR
jgi:hypothetical protein